MAQVEVIMPKMGESIMEATVLKWLKSVGDTIEMDEPILEIATDKVDSDVPSPVQGVLKEIRFVENDVVEIGKVIAIIATEGEEVQAAPSPANNKSEPLREPASIKVEKAVTVQKIEAVTSTPDSTLAPEGNRFYSPLVRNIAKREKISTAELDGIPGTGSNGRVTKKDILAYIEHREDVQVKPVAKVSPSPKKSSSYVAPATSLNGDIEIVEMDRMRRLIADHMVNSKHTSPHVTSFVEADVTNIVNWRNGIKHSFQEKYGEKITYTPIFMEAVIQAIADFPMVNVSVKDGKILVKKFVNIGMATALPNGNLIVPVIKNANHLNLLGLAKQVNGLANSARNNKLRPDDIQGGTFTLTNVGTFGNVFGTPIINQPQVAILAVGAIRKKPAVVETPYGDLIAVRQMMFLSLSYDHRVVDGFLGGSFLKRIADYLEAFDPNRTI